MPSDYMYFHRQTCLNWYSASGIAQDVQLKCQDWGRLEGRNFVLIGTVQLLQEPAKKRIQMGPEARSIVNQHVEFITYSLISTGMITERQCMSSPCCQLTERPIKIRCILIAFHQIILKQNNYRKLNNQLIGLSTKYGVSSRDGYINLFRLK